MEICSIDPVVVILVLLGQNKVEVPRDCPRPRAGVPNCLEFFKEEDFVTVLLQPIYNR